MLVPQFWLPAATWVLVSWRTSGLMTVTSGNSRWMAIAIINHREVSRAAKSAAGSPAGVKLPE